MVEDEDAGCAGSVGGTGLAINWASASRSERGMLTVTYASFNSCSVSG